MRIVATARYINAEIHGGNNSATADVAIDLTTTDPIADEIVVEPIPIMSEILPPAPFVPYLSPLQFSPPPILNPLPQMNKMIQRPPEGTPIPNITGHPEPPPPYQSHGDSSGLLLLPDVFPGENGWNKGGTVGMFLPSNVTGAIPGDPAERPCSERRDIQADFCEN